MTATENGRRSAEDRLLVIETRMEYVATKADLHDAIHTLTWRIVGIIGVSIVITSAIIGVLDKFVRPG